MTDRDPRQRRPLPHEAGAAAELQAARMLEQHGVRILARNFRTRLGEIDLIGRDGDTIVFVEVRRRSRAGYGSAGESITRTKQRRVIAAAKFYLRRLRAAVPCRFDAVLISDGDVIEWVRGAFIE